MIESSLPPQADLHGEPVLLPSRPFGRKARSVAAYAVLTALMMVASMPVFVPAALLHCAVRNGRRAAWATLLVTIGLVALYGAVLPVQTTDLRNMLWSSLAGVILTIALPTMVAIPLVERGEKFGRVLMLLLAGAMIGLGVTEVASQALLGFSPYAAQVAQTKELGAQIVKLYRDNRMSSDMIAMAERWSGFSARIVPAQLLIATAMVYVLSLMMHGRLSVWSGSRAAEPLPRPAADPSRPYLFRNFQLPDWVLFAFVFGGLVPLTHGLLHTVAANTLIVVVFLYVLQGLAVFRSVLLAIGATAGGALIAWSVLALLCALQIAPLMLGLVGLFDPFFNFRHFKKRKDDSHESHSD